MTRVTFLFTAYDDGRGSRSVRFYLRTTRGGRTTRPKTLPEIKNIISTSRNGVRVRNARRVADRNKQSCAAPRTDPESTAGVGNASETCFPRSFRTFVHGSTWDSVRATIEKTPTLDCTATGEEKSPENDRYLFRLRWKDSKIKLKRSKRLCYRNVLSLKS